MVYYFLFLLASVMLFGLLFSGLSDALLFKVLVSKKFDSAQQQKVNDTFVIISIVLTFAISFGLMFLLIWIGINYLTVVVYIIMFSLVFNNPAYKTFIDKPKTFKEAFKKGMIDTASRCAWLFIPKSWIVYGLAIVFLVIAQLIDLGIWTSLSPSVSEFFKLHEYAILILIGVDALIEHAHKDIPRIKVLLQARGEQEDLR